ncbi:hypothetical protein [Methylocystis sp.]|uniref:hypothetical protein n=1 Tax=Methylocystis sp. TaxID=1911079 RepID=UPI002600A7F3|nr:hypothetical protein [Methylocystis sp.]
MAPERKELTDEEIERLLDEAAGPIPKPRPKLVAEEGRVVAPAEVRVSPADPNFRFAGAGGFVRINMAEAERQRAWAEADAARERVRRKEIDPFGYGHWGAWED